MLSEQAKGNIRLVILHCSMFEYGFSQTPETAPDLAGRMYHEFAAQHLISTMFLVDKRTAPMGGFCYRALEPIGLGHLLEPIRHILEAPVGDTTFGDFVRRSRNKLAVHGDLSLASLPMAERGVPFSLEARNSFVILLERFAREIRELRQNLASILQQQEPGLSGEDA